MPMTIPAPLSLLFAVSLFAPTAQMADETDPDEGSMSDAALVAIPDDPNFTRAELDFFESEIRPLLIGACSGCHSDNGSRIRAGFEIDSRAAMLRGGDSGPGLIPGDPDGSLLIQAVRYDDPFLQMPPRGALSADEIAALERWVAMGAPMPEPRGHEVADAAPGTEFRWSEEDIERGRMHWAYQPVEDLGSPEVDDADWARSDLDRFVLAGLERRGVVPTNDATPESWLRRVTFDLTGLPPTPAEIAAFLADRRPDARERVVDRLLSSDAWGERWGRHWLDVARYAESSGKEANALYPHAWRYRDWVIAAFNEDIPYDHFTVMQIAGDLLPARTEDEEAANLIATGYLAIGSKSHATRGRAQFHLDVIDEQIDATTQGFLATTVACARCHDHKFDPIPQADYYALAGIFASSETRFGTVEAGQVRHASPLIEIPAGADLPDGPEQPMAVRRQAERVLAQSERTLAQAEELRLELRRSGVGQGRAGRDRLTPEQQRILVQARRADGRTKTAESVLGRFDDQGRPTIDNFVCMGVVEGESRDVPFLERGELDGAGERVPRGFPRLLDSTEGSSAIRSGSGRLELAHWIASEDNPLTARVWANRVWGHLLGRGIVLSPDNFGLSGRTPTNPDLLDHLAERLVALDWSTKALVREIVLSRTYGLSSSPPPRAKPVEAAELDVLTHGLVPHRRLEAEAIRDAMLAIAGVLSTDPPIASAVAFLEGQIQPQAADRVLGAGLATFADHRSVYLPIVRGRIPDELAVFDFPEPDFVAGDRDTTNVATQALYLMNAERVQTLADAFADRVMDQGSGFRERLDFLFRTAYGRDPSSLEFRACRDFLQAFGSDFAEDRESRAREESPQERRGRFRERRRRGSETPQTSFDGERLAWSALCHTIFQSSEFRTLD